MDSPKNKIITALRDINLKVATLIEAMEKTEEFTFQQKHLPLNEWIMPFGKHEGKKLSEIPKDYLEWGSKKFTGNVKRKFDEWQDKNV